MRKLYRIVITFLFLFIAACSSDKTDINIVFTPNPAADSIKYWEIYLEHRPVSSGFTIQDGMEYNEKKLKQFYLGKIYNSEIELIRYPTSVKKEYVKVGVIANNGIRSILAASDVIKINSNNSVIVK